VPPTTTTPTSAPRRADVTSADGTPIAVHRSGDGPPLVLVHGAAADHSRWRPVLPALEERFTVMAVDRRGRGGSGDTAPYSLAREVEDVVAVAEAAGPGAVLLGHSHGAMCALEAARRLPGLRALVLYEPPLGFVHWPAEVVGRLEALLADGRRDELLEVFLSQVAGLPPDQVALMRSLPAWRGRLAAAHTIPREERANREYVFDPARFAGVRVPALMLTGGDSPPGFHAAARAVVAALPDCRLAVMPGQRHAAMDTDTARFTAEVTAILERS
jgi:pimeloyl-ACP methyl ester carboxylesterase